MEQFESVKTMIDNLRSENADQRLNSMRGIHLIATTLGPSRTRDELLLYLTDYLDDNDEVLKVFATALGTMLPEVGGLPHISCLLKALEMLCSLDEITVREEAVLALQNLSESVYKGNDKDEKIDAKGANVKINHTGGTAATMNSSAEIRAKAQAEFVSLVQRLATGTPQCRSSACSLISTVYANTSANNNNNNNNSVKSSMLQLFLQLCKDKEIMVRRAACIAIANQFAAILGAKNATELLSALSSFAKDGSDGVRLQAVATAIALLEVLPEVHHGPILSSIKALANDSSWRVRYMLADKLGTFARAVSPADVNSAVVPIFHGLCCDAEPEIRAAAVYHMDNLLSCTTESNAKKDLLVTGTQLLTDANSYVRMSLAGAVLKSVKYVAKELWSTTIVPTCTALLNDEDADVRLALVSGFSSMNNSPEAHELAPKLVPVIITLAADPKWRLRDVVVSQIPHIITALGHSADQDVLEVCLERIVDRVATIRDAAVQSCCKLVASNGSSWASTVLLPRLNELAKDENYLHRVTLCHFYSALANVSAFDTNLCASSVWPTVQQLASDPIVNVRMNVAKVIKALQQNRKAPAKEADVLLRKLRQDANEDVRDAAAATTTTSTASLTSITSSEKAIQESAPINHEHKLSTE